MGQLVHIVAAFITLTLVVLSTFLCAVEQMWSVLMTPSGGGAFTMALLTIWGIYRWSFAKLTCKHVNSGSRAANDFTWPVVHMCQEADVGHNGLCIITRLAVDLQAGQQQIKGA